jgi:hypothetical protein
MFLFVAFTVLPSMDGVFAASFQTSGFVTLIGDETKKDWADIRIEYTFPDRVNSGDRFDVDVTLTYVKNDNAKIAYLEFFDVKVSVRNPDDKAIVTISKSDVSRRRAAPGERYTGRLSIDAPSQAGEYLVVLMWMTYNPEAEAYGEKMKAGELVWDISEWRDTPKARLVVQKLTAILELVSKSFTPKEGESIYSGDIVTARYELRNTGTASARAVKIIAETQKDVFTVEATPAKDIAPGGTELFILKLRFDKEGSYNVKVQLFSGDTLVQEAPLTVQVSPKSSSNYLIMGGGAIAIVAVAAVVMIMMKRKRAPGVEVMQIPTSIPSPPPQAPLRTEPKVAEMETETPAPAEGVKYCIHCGATIPDVVTFCTKCGKKQ